MLRRLTIQDVASCLVVGDPDGGLFGGVDSSQPVSIATLIEGSIGLEAANMLPGSRNTRASYHETLVQ